MEDKFKCRLCSRLFSNGRALGGHMKSHLFNLPKYPLKKQEEKQEEQEQEQEQEEREDSSLSSSNPARRRSGRVRRPGRADSDDPVSSVSSDTFSEEDVALSLMMLSRDTWWVGSPELKHKCEVCDKVFKSTQALGGHRTSHKKAKNVVESTKALKRVEGKRIEKKKIHKCPICNKVFGSGQALGGHKRSHFLISPINNNNASSSANVGDDLEDNSKSAKIGDNWIDLNMPAPMEDDDEMSAVSVAEFIDYC